MGYILSYVPTPTFTFESLRRLTSSTFTSHPGPTDLKTNNPDSSDYYTGTH